jgi:hypothetical protein
MVRRQKVVFWDEVLRAACIVALLVLAGLALWKVKLNMTSLHWYYREQLAAVYLGPEGAQGGAGSSEQRLSELDTAAKGTPYHLIQATLNLRTIPQFILNALGSSRAGDAPAEEGCTESFLFSRQFCGSDSTEYRATATYEKACNLHLEDAIALSGAAVSLTQINNPLILLLMAALNLRLGQWLPNPRNSALLEAKPGEGELASPTLGSLLSDGVNGPTRKHHFISDGGHYDNLGLESLLERRCSLVLVSDATCDPSYSFRDFLRVFRRVRERRGIELVNAGGPQGPALPLDCVRPKARREDGAAKAEGDSDPRQEAAPPNGKNRDWWSESHYFVAEIRYPKEPGQGVTTGLLIYLKPSITGDEPSDLKGHWAKHPEFPHDPTSNQLYDEDMVESYRQLGAHIGEQVCRDLRDLFTGRGEKGQGGRRTALVSPRLPEGAVGRPLPGVEGDGAAQDQQRRAGPEGLSTTPSTPSSTL